ncbi:testis-expressed protein 26 isoform 2-T2 [Thomomys bottae]
MKREFTPKRGVMTASIHHKSHQRLGFTYSLSDPLTQTLYRDEYVWKSSPKDNLLTKKDQPHADKDLIQWTLPKGHQSTKVLLYPTRTISASMEVVKRAISNQFLSCTKKDFVDFSKDLNMKESCLKTLEWKKNLPRPLDTEFRRSYQIPIKIPELQDYNFRYGCYSSVPIASQGLVPSVLHSCIKNQERIKKQTAYQSDYGKPYLDFLMILNSFSPSQVSEYLKTVSEKDRQILSQFLRSHSYTGQKKHGKTSTNLAKKTSKSTESPKPV